MHVRNLLRRMVLTAVLLAGGAGCGNVRAAEPAAPADNPYLAGPELSRAELAEFIDRMQNKPASVRSRPGFHEAVLDAADRILAADSGDEVAGRAWLVKLDALHVLADRGDKASDQLLAEQAERRRTDPRPDVADAARFYLLERQALDADTLETADLPPLVERLHEFFTGRTLDSRHVRLASATVKIINRLPDDAAAAKAYADFGKLWAASEDPELARYGRKIQKGPAKGAP